jgi:hypothetical protein
MLVVVLKFYQKTKVECVCDKENAKRKKCQRLGRDEAPEKAGSLVSQRNHGLVALAKCCDLLQSTLQLRNHHDWSKAKNRVPGLGEIPCAALAA